MNKDDVLLLGLKNRVVALSQTSGREYWSTALPGGGMGYDFVTILVEGDRVFAHSKGRLHALELATGHLLWTNDLPGLGYGMASLAIPGGNSAPDVQAVSHLLHQQNSGAGASAGAAGA